MPSIITPKDQLLFVRFSHALPHQLIISSQSGKWIWYDVFFCWRDAKSYLIPSRVGEPEKIRVACLPGERFASYWADDQILPASRIEKCSAGRVIRLNEYPTVFSGERFSRFCREAGYASGVIFCAICQDQLPVVPDVPDSDQCFCEHILWCRVCGCWSTPPFPESCKRGEEACPHYDFLLGHALKKHLSWYSQNFKEEMSI